MQPAMEARHGYLLLNHEDIAFLKMIKSAPNMQKLTGDVRRIGNTHSQGNASLRALPESSPLSLTGDLLYWSDRGGEGGYVGRIEPLTPSVLVASGNGSSAENLLPTDLGLAGAYCGWCGERRY